MTAPNPARDLLRGLRIPLMAAPMSIASSLEVVEAAALAGVIGCFPTHNARAARGMRAWIASVDAKLQAARKQGGAPGLLAVNINVSSRHRPENLTDALDVCREFRVPIITTNAGDPIRVVQAVHEWGGVVIHDAVTVEQVMRAIDRGVDGLMLVCAGAGGLGGLLSPFAFVSRVRAFYDGLIVLAGGIADGRGIAAAEMLGVDLVCMGTRFIATAESGAPEGHKRMLVEADISDVQYTDAICGINANFLKPSILANGLDPSALPPPLSPGRPATPPEAKPWSHVWSGGHSVGVIDDIPTVAELVARLERDYLAARRTVTQSNVDEHGS